MKRMRFIIPILLIIALLGVSLTGCVPSAPKAPVEVKSPADEKQTKDISDLQTLIKTKASVDTTQALDNRLKTLESASTSTDAYPKNQTYTKSQVDDAITEAIAQLKSNQSWITNSSSSSGGSSSSGDHLIDSDGDLELWLEDVNPSSEPAYFNNGSDNIEYSLVVKNTSNDNHRYRLYFRLTPEDQIRVDQTGTSITVYPNVLGAFAMDRADWDVSDNTNPIYFNQSTNRFIDDNDEEDVMVNITLNTVGTGADPSYSTFWSYRVTIEEME